MGRYFIHLSYRGTNYNGWQIQPNVPSIQGTLQNHLSTLLREHLTIVGAGRTDTGVHARNFYAHFDSTNEFLLRPKDFVFKLNRFLPNDISIFGVYPVDESCHARYDATLREYKYYIANRKEIFLSDYCWQRNFDLDLKKMNVSAKALLCYKDFTSFSKVNTDVKSFFCRVEFAKWTVENNFVVFTIKADRFLRNMVRSIVGTLIEVGTNRMTNREFINVIEKKNRTEAGMSVPAKGLFLEKITYPYAIGN